jgi:undecaprenyl-phosphate galactose phosphotransferase/putative colanic acid biosynthesis UDP-glucose lipid carrier transferase
LAYQVIEPLVAITDSIILVGASVAGGAFYQGVLGHPFDDAALYAAYGVIASVAYALAAYRWELYRLRLLVQRKRDYVRVAGCWLWAVLVVSVILFLMKQGSKVSRGSIVCFAVLAGLSLLSWRASLKHWLRIAIDRGALHGRRVVVLGCEEELAVIREGDLMILCGLDEVARISVPKVKGPQSQALHAAAVDAAIERACRTSALEVILALPWRDNAQLEFVRDRLRRSPLPVRLLPDRSVQAILRYRSWGPRELPIVEIQRAPLSVPERFAKRIVDLLLAGFALTSLMPLMLVIACAIRLESPGPAIFRQRRKGFNGGEFVIYKFRTMTVMEDSHTITQARKSDRRVTALGRILRQTSIDELPQLFNVLIGNMSLVGPRPHALAHDNDYGQVISNYAFRHHVKPGITGWAQVNGFRGETPRLEQMVKRIELDLWYINNWSLTLDLQILLRTSLAVVRGRNAY